MRGRDIAEGMVRLIKRQEAATVSALISSLQAWREQEVYKAQLKEDEAKQQSVIDKYDSLMVFCERCKLTDSPQAVIEAIGLVFEQGRGCCLSTVHKAKGLEAERCYLLEYGLFDHFAQSRKLQQWQRVQERNVKYVAVTRAQRELVYC
jgi:superfamily I DNA/RNA helicase